MRFVFTGAAAAVLLTACATQSTHYDPILPFSGSAESLNTISIPSGAMPEKAHGLDTPTDYNQISNTAMNQAMANPGISPGAGAAGGVIAMLVIAAIDASVDANRNKKINNYLEAQGVDAQAIFQTALEESLLAHGYLPSAIEAERDKQRVFDHASISEDENDATLVITLNHYGYRISGQGWIPSAMASVELRSNADGNLLLKDSIGIASITKPFVPANAPQLFSSTGGDIVLLPTDTRYIFKNPNEIVTEDSALGAEALQDVLARLATGITQMLPAKLTADLEEDVDQETTPDTVAETPAPDLETNLPDAL